MRINNHFQNILPPVLTIMSIGIWPTICFALSHHLSGYLITYRTPQTWAAVIHSFSRVTPAWMAYVYVVYCETKAQRELYSESLAHIRTWITIHSLQGTTHPLFIECRLARRFREYARSRLCISNCRQFQCIHIREFGEFLSVSHPKHFKL